MNCDKYIENIIKGIHDKKPRHIFIEDVKSNFAQVSRNRIGFIYDECFGLEESDILKKLHQLSVKLDTRYSDDFIDKIKGYPYISRHEIKDLICEHTSLDVIMDVDDLIEVGFFIDNLTK